MRMHNDVSFYFGENTMKKVCSRCGNIILHNQKCGCKPLDNRHVSDEKRRFYSSYAWRKLRNRKVKEQPYCERCWNKWKLIVTDNLQGHHIKSFKDYPELRLDEDNVVVLCRTCNLQVGDSSMVDW